MEALHLIINTKSVGASEYCPLLLLIMAVIIAVQSMVEVYASSLIQNLCSSALVSLKYKLV